MILKNLNGTKTSLHSQDRLLNNGMRVIQSNMMDFQLVSFRFILIVLVSSFGSI